MLKRCWLAVVLLLALFAAPGRAEAQYYFQLSDLETLFVHNQQFFELDDEGFGNPSLNHLHFASIDTTTGAFTGYIWAPQVVPAIPQMTMPVSGTNTIHPDIGSFGIPAHTGNYYEISFGWSYSQPCFFQSASYEGAITFHGYIGGKMQGNIAGSINVHTNACEVADFPYNPQPFSGILVK